MTFVLNSLRIDHLKDMFLTLDEDGSGELTLEEIDNAPEETQQQLKATRQEIVSVLPGDCCHR